MTKAEKYDILMDRLHGSRLYRVDELQKALFILGCCVSYDDLYVALKATGWIKLRLIRDRLLEEKRNIPKREPYSGVRHLVKWPLQVDRNADLPEWEPAPGKEGG